jgi:hypothetical protein
LSTLRLLNEMIINWPDAGPTALERITACDRAAMELASSTWLPFFEVAMMLEEQA